jgi:hypothetical protein
MWDNCMDAGGSATQEAKAEIIFRGWIPHKIKSFQGKIAWTAILGETRHGQPRGTGHRK